MRLRVQIPVLRVRLSAHGRGVRRAGGLVGPGGRFTRLPGGRGDATECHGELPVLAFTIQLVKLQ